MHGDPANNNDFPLNSIRDEASIQSLIIPFSKDPTAGTDDLMASFNPVIG